MHTVNHAFFKALLFLGAGAVIHSFKDQQDVRRMGGLIKFLPFTYSAMLAGSLSLLATPFLTAFYSKDLILELAYGHYSFSGMYAFTLGTITAGLTAFYSVRLLSLVFFTVPNGSKVSYENVHEANIAIIIPFIVLALFSILFGYVASDLFVGVGSDFLGNSVFVHPNNNPLIDAEFSLSPIIKLLPLICTICGAVFALFLYNYYPRLIIELTENNLNKKVYAFLNGKYYFDVVYNHYLVQSGLKLGYSISKNIDRGAIELLGPYALTNKLTGTGINISKLDTGVITTYSLYIVISLLGLIYVTFSSSLLETQYLDSKIVIIMLFALLVTLNYNKLDEANKIEGNPHSNKIYL